MAKANSRPRGRPPHKNSKAAPSEPGDEQGAYTHAQLIRMDNRVRARLLRAFRNYGEAQQAAGARLSELRRDGMKRKCTLPHTYTGNIDGMQPLTDEPPLSGPGGMFKVDACASSVGVA
jgi:hypothetical protein